MLEHLNEIAETMMRCLDELLTGAQLRYCATGRRGQRVEECSAPRVLEGLLPSVSEYELGSLRQ